MKYEAGNRFNPDTYFKTEVDSTSVTVKVTGELEGVEVSFDSGDVPEITSLSVTENGTYEAPEGTAYDPVTVEVPNSYTAADEGKVVSSGALVSQTSRTVTANDTYDTTLNNEIVVNVSGSGSSDLMGLIDRSITSINIPQGITSIGAYAFTGCNNLTSVSIPQGVTSAGASAFSNLPLLQNVTFPEGFLSLGDYSFYQNRVFTTPVTIDLPSTVTDIGAYVFRYYRELTLYCRAITPPTLGNSAFVDTGTNLKVYVPSESVEDYKTAWPSVAAYILAIPTT